MIWLFNLAFLFGWKISLVFGQTTERCDGLTSACFQVHYESHLDTAWGYLFPPIGRDEFVGLFIAPIKSGWIGSSLGGSMRQNLLIVGWLDDDSKAVVSPRMAPSFSPPQPYSGPKLTILGTSGSNGTHQRIVYRCENCTTWTGGTGGINLSGEGDFGYATHAAIKPVDPSNPNSSLYQHTEASMHSMNTVDARSTTYDLQLAEFINAPPLIPPTPTTTPGPDPTPTEPALCPNAPKPTYPVFAAVGW